MALRLLEGFESFGPSGTDGTALESALRRKYSKVDTYYSSSSNVEIVSGWGSGLAVQHSRTGYGEYIEAVFDTQTTWIVGFALKTPSSISTKERLIAFRTSDILSQCSLILGEDFKLGFTRGTATGTWLGGSDRVLHPSTWYYIECKVYIHDSAGTVDVNVNGVAEITLTSQDTRNQSSSAGASNIFLNMAFADDMVTDDLYIADGTSGVNAFIGPCKVEIIRPNGDDTTGWDPSVVGSHYVLVDETGEPSSTDYVEGDTLDELDLWDYGAVSQITSGIKGAQINTAVQLDAAGSTRKIKTPCKSSTTQSDGSAVALASNSYIVMPRVLEQDPHTSADWTISGINAVKAGAKVGD